MATANGSNSDIVEICDSTHRPTPKTISDASDEHVIILAQQVDIGWVNAMMCKYVGTRRHVNMWTRHRMFRSSASPRWSVSSLPLNKGSLFDASTHL